MSIVAVHSAIGSRTPACRRQSWLGRLLSGLGLQRKILLAITLLLFAGLSTACAVWTIASNQMLSDVMGEQASKIAYTLSLASKPAMQQGRNDELQQIGFDLLKSRNVLFVAFFDAGRNPLAIAQRDGGGFSLESISRRVGNVQQLMQVNREESASLGEFFTVLPRCWPRQMAPTQPTHPEPGCWATPWWVFRRRRNNRNCAMPI